jgi:hypothetical protein
VLVAVGLALAAVSSANATTVTYDLTFGSSGGATGVLTLDLPGTFPTGTYGLDIASPTSGEFVSLVVTDINNGTDYGTFDLTPSNVSTSGFMIKTQVSGSSSRGEIDDLVINTTDNDGGSGTTPFLDVTDNTWKIHAKNNSTVAMGAIGITGPFTEALTPAPLPATWPLFISGLGLIGLLSRRKTRKLLGGLATAQA